MNSAFWIELKRNLKTIYKRYTQIVSVALISGIGYWQSLPDFDKLRLLAQIGLDNPVWVLYFGLAAVMVVNVIPQFNLRPEDATPPAPPVDPAPWSDPHEGVQ